MKKLHIGMAICLVIVLALGSIAGAQDSPVPVTGVSLSLTTLELTVGQTDSLRATVTPANATNRNLIWTSSNTAVATVTATTSTDARVAAVAPGTAIIRVTTADGGITASTVVSVRAASPTATPSTGGIQVALLFAGGLVALGTLVVARRPY